MSDRWDISDSFSDGVGLMGLFRVFWELGGKPGYAAVLVSGSTREYSVVDEIVWDPIPGFPALPDVERDEGNPLGRQPVRLPGVLARGGRGRARAQGLPLAHRRRE